jgi:hypothetical protein
MTGDGRDIIGGIVISIRISRSTSPISRHGSTMAPASAIMVGMDACIAINIEEARRPDGDRS